MLEITVPGITGACGRMRKETKPLLAGSFTLLSGSMMFGKRNFTMPAPSSKRLLACELAPQMIVAGSKLAGKVSVTTTLKAVSKCTTSPTP